MKKIILIIALTAVVLVIGIYMFYRPVLVITADQLDNLHVALTVNEYGDNHEMQSYIIEDADTHKAVLDYLSTCKMHRTLLKKQSYQGLEFEIFIAGEANSPNIFIQQNGENNVTKGRGWFNYKLLNPGEVLEELREIVQLPSPEMRETYASEKNADAA